MSKRRRRLGWQPEIPGADPGDFRLVSEVGVDHAARQRAQAEREERKRKASEAQGLLFAQGVTV